MIDPKVKTEMEALGKSGYGKILRDLIKEELEQVCDIDRAQSFDDTLALQKHKKFLNKWLAYMEASNATKVDKSRNPYT